MVIVIGNHPDSLNWHPLDNHILIGCNRAYENWDLDHCVIFDRKALHYINKHNTTKTDIPFWTKDRYLQNRRAEELRDYWQTLPCEWGNAGATAIGLAHHLHPGEDIYCVGFNGILNPEDDTGNNVYDYPFRKNNNVSRASTRGSHRQGIEQALDSVNTAVFFVTDRCDTGLNTVTNSEFKYSINTTTKGD